MKIAIEIKNLHKVYEGGHIALKGIDLSIPLSCALVGSASKESFLASFKDLNISFLIASFNCDVLNVMF